MRRGNVMEGTFILELLLPFLIASSEGVHPGCECVTFSSTFGKEVGVFSSPDYPRPYPSHIDCLLYSFVAPPHHIVHIAFVDFDVRKTHLDCSLSDHVQVLVPPVNEQSVPRGVLCGGLQDVPRHLYSSGPALALAFHSSPGLQGNSSGFLGRFRFLDRRSFRSDGRRVLGTSCDQLFSSSDGPLTGRFYSPDYPSSYPANTTCKYYFRARENERIRLVFEEVSLQKGDLSCLESPDTVSVFDGPSPASAAILVLCDEATQLEVLSTGSSLYVELTTRSSWPGQGFRAAFRFQSDGQTHADDQEPPSSPCDRLVTSDASKSGWVTSPGYPRPYPARSQCRYHFQGRGRERVSVVFTDLRLASDGNQHCQTADSVSVSVWTEGREEQVWSACGHDLPATPTPLMSSGPRLSLRFRGSLGGKPGFNASYSFVNNAGVLSSGGRQLSEWPCAFSVNGSKWLEGFVTSPNFPGPYPRHTECHYFFHGRPGQRVTLRFNDFDVEGVQPCEAVSASDYVQLSSSRSRYGTSTRYCGQRQPFDVTSDGAFFRMTFRSNGRLDAAGFNASFRFLGTGKDSKLARREQHNTAMPASSLLNLWWLFMCCSSWRLLT